MDASYAVNAQLIDTARLDAFGTIDVPQRPGDGNDPNREDEDRLENMYWLGYRPGRPGDPVHA
jgi:hypothetical protein